MHLKDLGNLITAIDSFVKTGKLAENVNSILTESFKDMTAAQILAKTSTIELTDIQKWRLIQQYATDKGNYANVASVQALSASQKEAATTTGSLSIAFKGLISSIKSFVLANPALTIAAVATAAVIAGVAIYTKFNPSLKKATEALVNRNTL